MPPYALRLLYSSQKQSAGAHSPHCKVSLSPSHALEKRVKTPHFTKLFPRIPLPLPKKHRPTNTARSRKRKRSSLHHRQSKLRHVTIDTRQETIQTRFYENETGYLRLIKQSLRQSPPLSPSTTLSSSLPSPLPPENISLAMRIIAKRSNIHNLFVSSSKYTTSLSNPNQLSRKTAPNPNQPGRCTLPKGVP